MTGQTILNLMEVLNQELQLQTGETDVTRGLLALNAAQDQFESLAAQIPNVFGSGVGTVTTASNTETTAYPAGLLRLDSLHYLDPTTSRPAWKLSRLMSQADYPAGNLGSWLATNSTASGKTAAYWTNGTNIYWTPLPDGAYTLRYYGMIAAADLSAAGTFTYPDYVALPLAATAVRLLKIGLDDSADSIQAVTQECLAPALRTLASYNRDGGVPMNYTRVHEA